MSGYRGGSSQSLSAKDFNERAKALSERLGPVSNPGKSVSAFKQRRIERAKPAAQDEADSSEAEQAAPTAEE